MVPACVEVSKYLTFCLVSKLSEVVLWLDGSHTHEILSLLVLFIPILELFVRFVFPGLLRESSIWRLGRALVRGL